MTQKTMNTGRPERSWGRPAARQSLGSVLALTLLICTANAVAGSTERRASDAEPMPAATADSGSDAADGSGADGNADSPKKRRASRQQLDARLDALLAQTLPADEYRKTRSCLSRTAYRNVEVLNEEYVLFSKGEEHWINKLRRRCPSLRFNDLPVFVQKGSSSLCESDPFYPTNSMDLNMTLSGSRAMGSQGICYLGDFEQISAEQAALIRGS